MVVSLRAGGEDKYTHRPRISTLGLFSSSHSRDALDLVQKGMHREVQVGHEEREGCSGVVEARLLQNVVKLWIVKQLYEFVLFTQVFTSFLFPSSLHTRTRSSPFSFFLPLSHLL